LTAGLAVVLSMPTPSERVEILQAKQARLSRPVPAKVLQLIANQPAENIRELEGAINRVAAFADLSSDRLTVEAAREALRAPQPVVDQEQAPSRILDAICSYFNVTKQQLESASRSRDVTYARHVAMYLLRERTNASLADIGRQLGQRDHSTVLSGCRRIQKELAALPQTRSALDEIDTLLNKTSAA
jgi:chromosomal replication initiator protein